MDVAHRPGWFVLGFLMGLPLGVLGAVLGLLSVWMVVHGRI